MSFFHPAPSAHVRVRPSTDRSIQQSVGLSTHSGSHRHPTTLHSTSIPICHTSIQNIDPPSPPPSTHWPNTREGDRKTACYYVKGRLIIWKAVIVILKVVIVILKVVIVILKVVVVILKVVIVILKVVIVILKVVIVILKVVIVILKVVIVILKVVIVILKVAILLSKAFIIVVKADYYDSNGLCYPSSAISAVGIGSVGGSCRRHISHIGILFITTWYLL